MHKGCNTTRAARLCPLLVAQCLLQLLLQSLHTQLHHSSGSQLLGQLLRQLPLVPLLQLLLLLLLLLLLRPLLLRCLLRPLVLLLRCLLSHLMLLQQPLDGADDCWLQRRVCVAALQQLRPHVGGCAWRGLVPQRKVLVRPVRFWPEQPGQACEGCQGPQVLHGVS